MDEEKAEKQRIIQEYVPGKQVTMAHIIPNPLGGIHERLGISDGGAIGIMTITPSEAVAEDYWRIRSGWCYNQADAQKNSVIESVFQR